MPEAAPPPLSAEPSAPDALLPERVRLVYQQIHWAIFGNLVTVAAVLAVCWNTLPRPHLVGWALASLVVVAGRLVVPFPKGERAEDLAALRRWLYPYAAFTLAAGAIWSYVPVAFFPILPETHRVFYAFLAGGLAAAAAIAYAPIGWLGPVYYLPVLVPLGLRFLLGGQGFSLVMGWMVLFFTVYILAIQRNLIRSSTRAIELARRNAALVGVLREANRQAEHLNAELRTQIAQTRAEAEARAAVEAREERLRAMAEATPTALFLVDQQDRRVHFGNRRFQELFGFVPAEDNRPPVEELFGDPADAARCLPPGETGSGGGDEQVLMRTAAGREFWGLLSFQALTDRARSGLLCGVADITERIHLEQQLRQSQKMEAMGQLAGGMAHDFNNNLQVIRGYADVLHRAPHLDADTRRDLERILRAVEGASELTTRLLAFSRDQVLQRVRLDPNELIGEVGRLLHRLLGEDIELRVEPGPHLPTVLADRAMLQQVLLNLCVNAREAMPAGGTLTLATALVTPDAALRQRVPEAGEGPHVRITVRDRGRGMRPEVLERMFEPFFTTKPAGTGLGLSTAYGIVRQHRGFIDVHTIQGEGTTFEVYLPPASGAAESPPLREEGTSRGGQELILLAEDDEDVRVLVQRLLEARGYRVLTAENGERAMEVFAAHREEIRLALLDVVMPRQGGVETFERMRELRSDLPVIFCTGYTGRVLDDADLNRPAVGVLKKPYLPAQLFKTVRTMLDAAAGGAQDASG